MSRLQKTILILGFIISVFGIGFLLYAVFFKPFLPKEENGNLLTPINGRLPSALENGNIQILPETNTGLPRSLNRNVNGEILPTPTPLGEDFIRKTQASELTDTRAFFPSANQDGVIQYYDRDDGKFYRIDKNGTVSALTEKIFFEVQSVRWSRDGKKAALEYPDGANIIYDFAAKTQVTLPSHWTDFDFSPDSSQIVSKSYGLNQENNFLILSDSSGSKTSIIRQLGPNGENVISSWSPNNQVVAFYAAGNNFDQEEIFFIGQNNENFKSMLVEGFGFQAKWTPQGDKLLYSVHSSRTENKPELWIVEAQGDAIGRNRRSLKVETWAEKCAFYDNTTIYCAVPKSLKQGAGFFPDELNRSEDVIYKINISTGSKTLVTSADSPHTMENLILSPDGGTVYFTDKNSGKLYKIPLQ